MILIKKNNLRFWLGVIDTNWSITNSTPTSVKYELIANII